MEKIISFLNGPFIPLTVVIVGFVSFSVIYYKENKRINKCKKDIQRKTIDNYENNLKGN